MSNTAQGVAAVKQCRLPPSFGYRTDVSHGVVKTLSTANFASRTTREGGKPKSRNYWNNYKVTDKERQEV